MSTIIRKATPADLAELHEFGLTVPEIKVSATENFMSLDDLNVAVQGNGVFLVARHCVPKRAPENIVGFVYASVGEDRAPVNDIARLVYLVVAEKHRHRGLGQALLDRVLVELQDRGVVSVYAWANNSVTPYLERSGFKVGKLCRYMDMKLESETRCDNGPEPDIEQADKLVPKHCPGCGRKLISRDSIVELYDNIKTIAVYDCYCAICEWSGDISPDEKLAKIDPEPVPAPPENGT